MKIFRFLCKKIICSSFLLYGYNLIATNFNMMIPINFYSVMITSFLGSSGLIGLILFKYYVL